ncbi:hypothetical protein SAMN04487947_2226 [Halogeometricum rufum]|uniref:DUF456 domain-containing protein n=1 Tax=Halogeometricum rufum TaxID=553469 RepID=A0A1I6HMQ3_9EURY|nr:DUF456 domain-containing protein [Halogeometricum rufum]MUV57436.1 DUF456 family protein [Halogeometricum sp. CBA1124]SFR55560.1 hypothetical protein SAMN04487947_2226 [Halogeometricum rufum]
MDIYALVAIALAVVGVVGVVVPLLPGALLSVAGALLYWWSTGYTDPSLPVLAALVFVGVLTVVLDYFGGAIAARAGGASSLTTGAAVVVGLVLLVVTGPVGFLLGIAATVFAVEFYRNEDAEASVRVALYATVGVLASTVVQVLLTSAMLVVLVLAVLF